MFSTFKQEDASPIRNLFIGISTNQKYSILNLLHLIGNIEGSAHKADEMIVQMNFYVNIFKVKAVDAMNYFQVNGTPRVLSDLNKLGRTLKEVLVLIGHDFVSIGGKPTVNELKFIANFFNEIGITPEQYIEIVTKNEAIKYFMKEDKLEEEAWASQDQRPLSKEQALWTPRENIIDMKALGNLIKCQVENAVAEVTAMNQTMDDTNDPWVEIKKQVSKEEVQMIESFMQPDRISPDKFYNNLALLNIPLEGLINRMLYGNKNEQIKFDKIVALISPTMHRFIDAELPEGVPKGYIAAYPDVLKWVCENEIFFESEFEKVKKNAEAWNKGVAGNIGFYDLLRQRCAIDCFKTYGNRKLECQQ